MKHPREMSYAEELLHRMDAMSRMNHWEKKR